MIWILISVLSIVALIYFTKSFIGLVVGLVFLINFVKLFGKKGKQ